MRFDTRQSMHLSQQMKLAPRMIQSMEILQMPMLALQERIEQELESNIALEQVEPGVGNDQVREERVEDERERRLDEQPLKIGETPGESDDWARLSSMESNYSDAYDNQYSSATFSGSRLDGERDRKLDAMANVAAREAGLAEQLMDQWRLVEVGDAVIAAGERIINYIDDDGMLAADLETILDQNRQVRGIEMSADLYREALEEIQWRLDPPGIGARTRRECLLIQIDRLDSERAGDGDWSVVRTLIADHYDDLLQNRLPKIAQATELTMVRIQDAIRLMRRLNLSPARSLVDVGVPTVRPDVIVEYDEDADAYVARLADGTMPMLRVSSQYERMAKDRTVDRQTREFVSTNVRNATWLIDSINQRKATLLRVVNVVLARQRDYFDQGSQSLHPLPMTETADQLGIHVGTVSRAVADKYLQTPRGIVPLRMFFSGGMETDSGENMSWEAIKSTLKEIIDAEDKTSPLSDEALARALKDRGIDIARRTVVKYRSQLGIPAARMRKVHV